MKILILLTFFSFALSGFSQDTALLTFGGHPVNNQTCIFKIKIATLLPVDSIHHEIRKPKISNFISYLTSCDPKYTFDDNFQDQEFRLVVPKYLCKVSYELGNQKFAIVLRDTTSLGRTIAFSYDLDDSYRNHFLTHDNMGFKKIDTVQLNNQIIHRFINWDEKNGGTIFTSNHLHISYLTKSKEFERELEEVISNFKW